MHPAASVIVFTVASGLGYGILILAPLLTAAGLLPPDRLLGAALLLPALAFITLGLLASTAHLGHPERAWRAVSQWKSSWLSREGLMAILTYAPALAFTYGWVVQEDTGGVWALAGYGTALAALITLFTTAMIYRSLTPIPAWATDWTVAGYLVLGPLTGLTLIAAVAAGFGLHPARFQILGLVLTVAAAVIKNGYWKRQDTASPVSAGSAVGSPGSGVRSVEWPHTETNYVLKEMGYRVARKHADKLRGLTRLLLFAVPFVCLGLLPSLVPMPYLAVLSGLGALLTLAGVMIERWLFFAEAKHVVTLYYGA